MNPTFARRFLVLALAAAVATPFAAVAQSASSSSASSSTSMAKADADFVKKASASGLAEVKLGQLGADKGNSDGVKTFGQQMVTDHGKANDELKAIAARKNLTVSTMPMPKDEKAATHIGAMSGDGFDQAFKNKMVMDHEKAVTLFTKESTSGKDPDLKAFATKTLPTLKQHLEMAQRLPAGGMTPNGSMTSK